MTQQQVVDRISSEILFYKLNPEHGMKWFQMYIAQAYAAGYDHRINGETIRNNSFKRERAFP